MFKPIDKFPEFNEYNDDLKYIQTLANQIYPDIDVDDKGSLARSMDEGCDILPSSDIERANKILDKASKTFSHKYLSKRYFIEWVIDEFTRKGSDIDKVLPLLDKVTQSNAKELYDTRSNGDITKITEIIYRANELA